MNIVLLFLLALTVAIPSIIMVIYAIKEDQVWLWEASILASLSTAVLTAIVLTVIRRYLNE